MRKYFSLISLLMLGACLTTPNNVDILPLSTQVYDARGNASQAVEIHVVHKNFIGEQLEIKVGKDLYSGGIHFKTVDEDNYFINSLVSKLIPGIQDVETSTTYSSKIRATLTSSTKPAKAKCSFTLAYNAYGVKNGSIGTCFFDDGRSIPIIFGLKGAAPTLTQQDHADSKDYFVLGPVSKSLTPARIFAYGETFEGGYTPSYMSIDTDSHEEHSVYSKAKNSASLFADTDTSSSENIPTSQARAVLIGNQGHFMECTFNLIQTSSTQNHGKCAISNGQTLPVNFINN